MKKCLILFALPLLWSCANMDYDTSRGIDKEVTLFSDEVSLPIGDIGPITPKTLLDGAGFGDQLKSFVQEDADGYLVLEMKASAYSNPCMLVSMILPDPSKPASVAINDYSGNLEFTNLSILEGLGITPVRQDFVLTAGNPLTEEISFSGKLTLSAKPDGSTPGETIQIKEFSQAKAAAEKKDNEVLRVELTGGKAVYSCKLENATMQIPASILEKDPLQGWGFFTLDYHYKAFVGLEKDIPVAVPISINDLNLPLGQFRVKEAKICTEVSNEIPISIGIDQVVVMIEQAGEDGKSTVVPSEDISITPGLVVSAGSSGNPTVTPLEIVIKANEGIIPDIRGLRIDLRILAPTGVGDKRLGMKQSVSFNRLRATVSGGITVQGL